MIIFFYLFSSLILISSILVVASKNPVYSVLWLIFAFCNASGLMILLGAEFLAMMLIVIYVGAVAVLFLFVIMMIDVNFTELKGELMKNLSAAIFLGLLLFADLVLIISLGIKTYDVSPHYPIPKDIGNVYAIGMVLYTDFILPFQTAGIILFVAMISCISLTLRVRIGVKRQNISKQLGKNKSNSVSLVKVQSNLGVGGIKYDQ